MLQFQNLAVTWLQGTCNLRLIYTPFSAKCLFKLHLFNEFFIYSYINMAGIYLEPIDPIHINRFMPLQNLEYSWGWGSAKQIK